MSLLAPGLLLFGLLAGPVLLLYMLKLRRRDTLVSSNLLWQQILRDRQANTPWQRLKRNLLLLLQLLILAALVLALARPAIAVPSLTSGATVIVLDGSASMNATDVDPTRFDAARAKIRALIDGLPANTPVTLILAGREPRLLTAGETDRAVLRKALDSARADSSGADWPAALTLAAGGGGALANASTTVIVSDGGLPQSGLPGLVGEVKYLPVGTQAENLAVTALSVRPLKSGSSQLFASVANYGDSPQAAILSIYSGDSLVDARQVNLKPGKSQDLVLSGLPEGSQGYIPYTARLSSAVGSAKLQDGLPLDDAAFTVYRPAPGGRTLLVSPGNLFLRQLLESLPVVKPFVLLASPNTPPQIPADRYDVYILDGVIPKDLPPGNLLILNPPENEFFPVSGTFKDTGGVQLADSPLARFVSWDNVHVLQAKQVRLPDWAEALVQAKGGPLVFTGETQGRRLAVITFDLHDSDLPLQISYPVLFSNLIQYLIRPSNLSVLGGQSDADLSSAPTAGRNVQVQAGASILIHPSAEAPEAKVTAPDGSSATLSLAQGQAVFNATNQTGIYTVSYPGRPALGEDAFAVNLLNPAESDIHPRESIQIGQKSLASQAETQIGQRELWPWLAALALLVLLLEWWLYHRRQIGPGKWDAQGILALLRYRGRARG